MDIHDYLLEISTEHEGLKFVLIPITEVVKKFERNHRTIQRRISALKEAGLITPVIKKNTITLYRVVEQEDQPLLKITPPETWKYSPFSYRPSQTMDDLLGHSRRTRRNSRSRS